MQGQAASDEGNNVSFSVFKLNRMVRLCTVLTLLVRTIALTSPGVPPQRVVPVSLLPSLLLSPALTHTTSRYHLSSLYNTHAQRRGAAVPAR